MVAAHEIAATLAAEIASLPPGTRVASEHELMRRFGSTRAAARCALDELAARFLVRRTQGAGTFVNRRIDYVIGSRRAPSLHKTVAASGATARTALTGLAELPAPAHVAARLECEPGAIRRRLTRIGYIDERIASYAEEWLADGIVDNIDIRLRVVESLSDALRDSKHRPIRAWTRAGADFMPPPIADRLAAPEPAAAWRIETLTRDAGSGDPLIWSETWMRQDMIRVVVELEASEQG